MTARTASPLDEMGQPVTTGTVSAQSPMDYEIGSHTPGSTAGGGKTAAALILGSARILLADQDLMTRRMLASFLTAEGYDVVTTSTCEAIMPALEEHAIDVVLLDIGFPQGNGLDVMRQIHLDRRYTDLPIVILSSPTHRDDAIGALGFGADDFVMKPIEPRVLISRVQVALRSHRAMLGMEAARSVVVTLANEINAPDMDIGEHTQRIGAYAAELGRRVGLSAADMHAVAYSTLLHDLGKIGIADSILLKRGPLSADERIAINRHTEIAERIAAPLPGARHFTPIIRHHHERWDGAGYPDGLHGQAIPMGARIIGIVDAFDAMTQFRPYRESRSVSEAIEELRRERGRQFDPNLVDAFVRILEWDGIL